MVTRPALPEGFLRLPVAHRAYHDAAAGRPENSLAAVHAAIAQGYAIEIDVQPSRDQVPMVFHDYDLKRLTGTGGKVNAFTANELSGRHLLGTGETIPTLRDVLNAVAGRVPLLIEVKDQDGDMGTEVGPLEAAVTVELSNYSGPIAVMSFNPESVAAMARLAPDVPRGITTSAYRPEDWPLLSPSTCERLRDIPDYDRVGAVFVSHEASDLARSRVATLKQQGAAILCWTIRSPAAELEARKIAQNVTFERYAARIG